MVSVSDYIVSCTKELRSVCEIVRKKFKNANIIHYENGIAAVPNPYQEHVMSDEKDFSKIVEEVAKNDNKIGSRILPIQQLHVFLKHSANIIDPNESKVKGLMEKIIEFNEKSNRKIELVVHEDLDRLLEVIEKEQTHSAVLFVRGRSGEVNNFKRRLLDKHMENRVLVIVLRSDSYKDKLEEYAELSKYFHVQRRVVRTVDWINKHIKEKYFDLHKRELLVNNIKTVEFTSFEEYRRAIEEKFYSPSYYVLCTASTVDTLEAYLTDIHKHKNMCPRIVCFDSRENVMTVRKKRIFMKSDVFSMANNNIKEIIEEVKKNPHEYLVTDNVQTKRQMKAYSEVKDTFVELKSHFFRFETSAFNTV